MGTIYNVPIKWNRNSSTPSYKEGYTGTLQFTYPKGNTVTGTFGEISGLGSTRYTDVTVYWNWIEVRGTFYQDATTKEVDYYREGRYYPNGKTYNYAIDFAEKLIQANSYYINIEDGQSMFEVGTLTKSSTIPLDVSSVTVVKPTNFTTVGSEIFNDITVKFELAADNKIDYQVIQDGKTLINKTNQTGKQFIIPYGTLQTTNSVTVKVRTHFNFLGTEHYSDWVTTSFSGLKSLTAEKPANVRIVGTQKAIEEDITFAWDTSDTLCKGTVEVWQDGVKITEQSNIANKQYILRAGTLKSTNAIKIRVSNTLSKNGYTNTSAYTELSVNDLVSIKPRVTEFTLATNNADYPIQATITATNAETYEIYNGATKLVSSASNVLTIPEGFLVKGNNSLKAVALRNSGAGILKGELIKTFSITQDEPVIYAVEPSNINVNVDELAIVSFSANNFIHRWELFINGSLFITGTTEREIPVSGGMFRTGANILRVIAYYSPAHNTSQVRVATKEVTFTGFGKPQAPVLDANSIYDSATPTFTWITGVTENDAQVAFDIEVHTESKTVNSSEKNYTMSTALENNKDYTVRVRIKNKFEMWSEWSEKNFKTVFSELPKPDITLSPQKENVLIMIECEEVPTFKQMVIYRSIDKVNWIEIANDLFPTDNLIDFMVAGGIETFYKARIYDDAGGYSESEVKSIKIKLINYNLLNVQDLRSNKQLDFVAINFTNNFTSVTKIFAGATKPIFYKSKRNYLTANMVVKLVNEEVNSFIEYLSKGDIFCYRDYKGKKIFVSIDMTAINYINPFMQEIVLTLTEVNFNEKLAGNKATYTRFVYLNGEYFLDGAIDLSGWGADL